MASELICAQKVQMFFPLRRFLTLCFRWSSGVCTSTLIVLIFVYVPFLNTRSVFRRRALTGASRFSCVLLGGFDSLQYFVVRRFFFDLICGAYAVSPPHIWTPQGGPDSTLIPPCWVGGERNIRARIFERIPSTGAAWWFGHR